MAAKIKCKNCGVYNRRSSTNCYLCKIPLTALQPPDQSELPKPILVAGGRNGLLFVYQNTIIIRRQLQELCNPFLFNPESDREIMIDTLSSIQLKKVGPVFLGHIRFMFEGSRESKLGRFFDMHDENSIIFTPPQEPLFLQAKSLIENRMQRNARY